MAFDFQTHDAPDIAPLVRQDDQSRSAKDRRRFAAVEALPLGHGGTPDMAHLLGCAPHPIQAGLRELPPLPDDPAGPRVGPLSRPGTVSCPQALQACEPACPRRARGVLMPPGIDALAQQHGGMHGGRSRETTAGACESLRLLWDSDGRRLDPNASALLLVGAGGGRNRCHTPRCQAALPAVVNDLAGPIRVAPSPASGSKGNPIERRLFGNAI